jgi:DNA-binding response OmpR family regulator
MTMNKQIMIVDDEIHMLALMEVILKRQGFTVLKATDAFTALKMLDSLTPDLFILDIMIPGIDGIELCRLIRALPRTARTPVIMFSVREDQDAIQRSLAAGADEYIPKAARHNELVDKIHSVLGTHQRLLPN